MSTGISWTDETWNPVIGCSRVSPGCQHCYAEVQAARIVRMGKGKPTPYDDLVRVTAGGEPRWTGVVRLLPERLSQPLRWKSPRRIFVNSMSDLFHESLTNEQIAAVFGVMAACPQHTFQVLTKRAKRMREWFEWAHGGAGTNWNNARAACQHFAFMAVDNRWPHIMAGAPAWPLPNVWLGVSVENQEPADERIPELLRTPAAVRFLSCEPLLGAVDLDRWVFDREKSIKHMMYGGASLNRDQAEDYIAEVLLHWIIAGCESGPGARPCSVEWLRSLRDQCAAAGVPFFLKQASKEGQNARTGYAITRTPCTGDVNAPIAKQKPGGVIELPYLDGVQHAAFPNVERTIHG